MKRNAKTKKGEKTNVKPSVINFRPLNTKSRKDDEVWNSMEFMCEDDDKEAEYESPNEVSQRAMERISRAQAKFIGARMMKILNVA